MKAMHHLLPTALPSWALMVDSLGRPTPAQLSKWLGVSERTIWNYHRKGEAPRAVMLALFWMTPWGFATLDCDRENLVRVLQGLSESLRNEASGLRVRIARLERTGDFGAVNDPAREEGAAELYRRERAAGRAGW